MLVNPFRRQLTSQHPTQRTSISTHTCSGARVNQAEGKLDFLVLVLMELLVFSTSFPTKVLSAPGIHVPLANAACFMNMQDHDV